VGGDNSGRVYTTNEESLVHEIVEIDPLIKHQPLLNIFTSPSQEIVGMAFDGMYLYVSDTNDMLYILDPDDGTVLNSLDLGFPLYALAANNLLFLAEQIQDILDFIDASIGTGDLVGAGPGRSADNRLNALINMIENARTLITSGNISEACGQLDAAYKKCDGELRPPDFVAGVAAVELADMILAIRASLGCE
jgi:hypothetical protein